RPVVARERKMLINQAHRLIFVRQTLGGGVRFLAMWALQIAELQNQKPRPGRPARPTGNFLLQLPPGPRERLPDGRNDVADHRMPAMFADEKLLSSLPLRPAYQHIDFGQAFGFARSDAHDLPRELRVVAECLLQEATDLVFGGQVRGGVGAELV